ncbi:MAG: hypothetical protein AAGD05_18040, partial [Bacteroidota bacterium]
MKSFLLFLLCLSVGVLQAQYRIKILNPSFEQDNAAIGVITKGWFGCGDGDQVLPPDLHSDETNFFNVRENAAHGSNYISLIARRNKTWEAIGQRLTKPLDQGQIHHIAFRAKLSKTLRVYNQNNYNLERYNQPIIIKMWAGNQPGSKQEFLGATQALDYVDWTKVNLLFRPSKHYRFICFDAQYASEDGSPYNGNVLLDRFSPISIVPDTTRYRPICVDNEVLQVIDKKLVTDIELEHLATQFITRHLANGYAPEELPKHLLDIARVSTFQWRRAKAGAKKYFYTEKMRKLNEVILGFQAIKADKEAQLLLDYMSVAEHLQNDHFTRKAARKLSKQFSKVDQVDQAL